MVKSNVKLTPAASFVDAAADADADAVYQEYEHGKETNNSSREATTTSNGGHLLSL